MAAGQTAAPSTCSIRRLVGAWPIGVDRVQAFMTKAVREAKLHTTWTDPDEGYEQALGDFITAVLADEDFLAMFEAFLAGHHLIARGRLNSLAQVALLLTCPGVPDLYQGTEIWDLSLVDPDNRRPVDYEAREALLTELAEAAPAQALARDAAGGSKIWLISKLLAHRQAVPAAYDRTSGYQSLEVSGEFADRFIAFARSGGSCVIVPRLATGTPDPWTGTEVTLPPGSWVSVLDGEPFSGGTVSAAALLRRFPVQILTRDPA